MFVLSVTVQKITKCEKDQRDLNSIFNKLLSRVILYWTLVIFNSQDSNYQKINYKYIFEKSILCYEKF